MEQDPKATRPSEISDGLALTYRFQELEIKRICRCENAAAGQNPSTDACATKYEKGWKSEIVNVYVVAPDSVWTAVYVLGSELVGAKSRSL